MLRVVKLQALPKDRNYSEALQRITDKSKGRAIFGRSFLKDRQEKPAGKQEQQ